MKSDPHTLFDNLDLLIDDGLILVDPNREVVRAINPLFLLLVHASKSTA